MVLQDVTEEKLSVNLKVFYAYLQNIYEFFAHFHRRWNSLLDMFQSTKSLMIVVNKDNRWYKEEEKEEEEEDRFNNFDYKIDNDQLDTRNISKMVNTSKFNTTNLKRSLRLKAVCKIRWSVRVQAAEALREIFLAVLESLENESTNSETNSESLFSANCMIKTLNWVFL